MYNFRADHLVLYNQLDLSLQKTNYLLHVEEIYTNNKKRDWNFENVCGSQKGWRMKDGKHCRKEMEVRKKSFKVYIVGLWVFITV